MENQDYGKMEQTEQIDPRKLLANSAHWVKAVCNVAGIPTTPIPEKTQMWKRADATLSTIARSFVIDKFPSGESMDARAHLYMSDDNKEAFFFIFPPLYGGRDIQMVTLLTMLREKGITFGVLRTVIADMISNKKYCLFIKVAEAQAPVKGEDGRIVELEDPESTVKYVEDERGNIDFKNLNSINNIIEGTRIAEIIHPTQGTDGMDIKQNVIPALPGKAARPPIGRNVGISEDENFIVAQIDGLLSFSSSNYHVDDILEISGNIDASTGNIEFLGDVYISGDVKSGFSVKAGGSIFIKGVVEDCVLTAGQDIILAQGANGTSSTIFTAGGELKAKYLEHCTLVIGDDVTSDVIINCDVSSNGAIIATSGVGAIIGGTIHAHNAIEANAIGNKTGTMTTLYLGASRETKEKRENLKVEVKTSKETLKTLAQNLRYLDSLEEKTEKQKDLEKVFRTQIPLYEAQLAEQEEELDAFTRAIRDYSQYHITAKVLHPTVSVSIGSMKRIIHEFQKNVRIRRSEEGEILLF